MQSGCAQVGHDVSVQEAWCTVYHSSCDRHVVFCANENLCVLVELEHNLPYVMLRLGITAFNLMGSCFFSGPVNTISYA